MKDLHRIQPTRILSACVALLFVVSVAAGQTRYVTAGGDDGGGTNDCLSDTTPCATIQHAVDEASAGDTLSVAPGAYAEDVTVDKTLTLQGPNAGITAGAGDTFLKTTARGAEAVLDGGFRLTASDVTLDGFKILHGVGPAGIGDVTAVFFAAGTTGHVVQNNVITGVTATNLAKAGAGDPGPTGRGILSTFGGGNDDILIQNNDIGHWITGVFNQGNTGVDVIGNYVHDTLAGVANDYVTGASIAHNDFAYNGEAVGVGPGTSGIVVFDNDLGGNTTTVAHYAGDPVDARYNWWGSTDTATIEAGVRSDGTLGDAAKVGYTPYLPDGTDRLPDDGFQGYVERTIGGTVTDGGSPFGGVDVTIVSPNTGAGGTETTDGSGHYAFAGLPDGGTYTLTPSAAGKDFAPGSRSYPTIDGDRTADFITSAGPVPGVIIDETATVNLGSGASLSGSGSSAAISIEIPPQTGGGSVDVEIGTFDPAPGGLTHAGPVFYFGPIGTTFDPPAIVTLSYSDDDIPDGIDEADVRPIHFDETTGTYEVVPDVDILEHDTDANTFTFEIHGFSGFGAGVPTDVSIEVIPLSEDAPVGTPATFLVKVTNNGPALLDFTNNLAFPLEVTLTALGNVTFAPVLPLGANQSYAAGVWTYNADLPAGSSVSFMVDATRTTPFAQLFEAKITGAPNVLLGSSILTATARITSTDPDIKVTIVDPPVAPRFIGDRRKIEVLIENVRKKPITDLELEVNVATEVKLTGENTIITNCASPDLCGFAKIDDQRGGFVFKGTLDEAQGPISLKFEVENVAIGQHIRVDAFTTSFAPAEANDAQEDNFDTNYIDDVRAPDLFIDIAAERVPGGAVSFPATFTTGDRVKVTVTVENMPPPLPIGNAQAATVLVSVPGLDVDLLTPFTSTNCTVGTDCSFDPTSGIFLIGKTIKRAPVNAVTLTFEGVIRDLDFAGPWGAQITSVTPIDADYSNHDVKVGVTINEAPVWQRLHSGPFDGTVTRVFATPGSVRVFAGTDGDGAFHSGDGGANWCHEVGDVLGPYVRGLVFGRDDVGRGRLIAASYDDVVAGDGRGGIFISTDGGRTWELGFEQPGEASVGGLPDPRLHSLLAFDTGGDTMLAVGSEDGIYISDDLGNTWSTNHTPASGTDAVFLSLASDDATPAVILGGTAKGFVFRSTNSGASFTRVPGDPLLGRVLFDLAHATEGGTSTFYAATDAGLYRSTDDGSTWTFVSVNAQPGPHPRPLRSVVAYRYGGKDYVIAGGDGGEVWLSSDGGASFTLSGIGFPNLTVFDLFQIVDPDSGTSLLYAGSGNGGLFVSFDHGMSWSQSQIALPAIEVNALAFDGGHGAVAPLVAGTWGLGVYHDDPSCGWEPIGGQPQTTNSSVGNRGLLNPWIHTLAISPETNTFFAGTAGNGVFRSVDKGGSWQQSGLPNLNVYDVGIFTGNDDLTSVLAGADRGFIYRSIDDGLTWTHYVVGSSAVYAVLGLKRGVDLFLAGTFGEGIYKSVDGDAAVWTQTNLTNAYVYDLVEDAGAAGLGDEVIFAATATGIQQSTDDGDTWTALTDPLVNQHEVRALTLTGGKLYASIWGGDVLVSDPSKTVAVDAIGDPGTWFSAGLDEINVRAFYTHLTVVDDQTYEEIFAVSEDGQIYTRRQVAGPVTTVDTEDAPGRELPTAYALDQNYPNPFNPSTTIDFDLPEAARARLTVYDMLGRRVRVLVDGRLPAGHHQAVFDATGLSSGLYVYELEAGGQRMTRKMILMK